MFVKGVLLQRHNRTNTKLKIQAEEGGRVSGEKHNGAELPLGARARTVDNTPHMKVHVSGLTPIAAGSANRILT